jgi:hypothetical protein
VYSIVEHISSRIGTACMASEIWMRIHTVFSRPKQQALPNIYAPNNNFCKGCERTRERRGHVQINQLLTMKKESREVSDGPVLHNHRTGPVGRYLNGGGLLLNHGWTTH